MQEEQEQQEASGNDYRWGMAVDLDRCTGCEACVTACHAENNIPTVGPDQAGRGRAMHWIRVERYFEGEFPDVQVKFRPVFCQQCDNAPCEPVCPTYASHHTLLRQCLFLQCTLLQLLQPGVGKTASPPTEP